MNTRVFLLAAMALTVFAPALAPHPVQASDAFNGEVLIAPPPPNWSGGTPEKTKTGIRREWTRKFLTENGVLERIVVTRTGNAQDRVAGLVATQLSKSMIADCKKPTVSDIKRGKADIGTTASFTVQCAAVKDPAGEKSLFGIGKVFIGEFHTYTVARTWRGQKDDPGGPANSPRTGAQWAAYFDRIFVCNTLTRPCDPAVATTVHADPRFTTMRAVPVAEKPVITAVQATTVARKLGLLTGRAEACGEDVAPLTSKIGRMFAQVTSNDQDSSKAVKTFGASRTKGQQEQDKKSKESCGQILRDFRAHPSRVGAFYRYIEQFL